MEQTIICKYWNPILKIAFYSWQQVYLIDTKPKELRPEVHKGNLVYRIPGTYKRIGYFNIKKDLVRKNVSIVVPFQLLPF
jgi:hypothetical protein